MNLDNYFKVNSTLCVGDPPIGCVDVSSKRGKWFVHIERLDCRDWGRRISRIIAHHEKFNPAADLAEESIWLAVHTGQLGLFDSKGPTFGLDRSDPEFKPHGFVCTSGFGDGTYEAKVLKEDGKAVCVEITFIFTDEEIEEERLTR